MDDIAERAGVSKPVLYQHFPGKLELYLALLDTHCDAIIAKVRSAMLATPDNKERVKGAVRAYFDFVDHESEAFRLVFESDLRNDPQVRERVERVEQGCIAAVTDTIMSDTGVSRPSAELLASGLVGAAGQSAQFWLANGRQTPKAEAEALVAALIWRGIAELPAAGWVNAAEHRPKSASLQGGRTTRAKGGPRGGQDRRAARAARADAGERTDPGGGRAGRDRGDGQGQRADAHGREGPQGDRADRQGGIRGDRRASNRPFGFTTR